MRGLAAIYVAAFASLWVQVAGLLGSDGIRPAAQLLARAAERLGTGAALLRIPTLLWIDASDPSLHALCAAGVLFSLAALAGAWPRLALFACWLCYLSLVAVGDVFLSYQWDVLLLETGVLALLYAPPGLRLSRARGSDVSGVGLWLLRYLAFRLFFLSGWVKIASGDPAWRTLSALEYHWWSQPLPIATSVLAASLPDLVQRAEVALTLVIECLVPLAIFAGRRMRLLAAGTLVLFQLGIAATGNYGFFNALSIVLCIPLCDDAALAALVQRIRAPLRRPGALAAGERAHVARGAPAAAPADEPARGRAPHARGIAALACGAVLALLATCEGAERLGLDRTIAAPVEPLLSLLAPLRSVNSYGLFAVMTTRREEIEVLGSDDGSDWRPYAFRYKPGAVDRTPRLAPLHMPRLDWQMWFAALGHCEDQGWLHAFLLRVLEGSPDVLALLETDPFPDHPPRYVRTRLWDYRFAAGEERRLGDTWTRRPLGLYCPDLTLEDGKLALAPPLAAPAD